MKVNNETETLCAWSFKYCVALAFFMYGLFGWDKLANNARSLDIYIGHLFIFTYWEF
jgi:hypothetical protein